MAEPTTLDVAQIFAARVTATPRYQTLSIPPSPGTVVFGGGIPDPLTFPVDAFTETFREILQADNFAAFNYGGVMGFDRLRDAIAQHINRRDGLALSRDNIMLTNGVSQGVATMATTFLDPDDVMIVEEKTFPGSLLSFRLLGAKIVPTPIDEHGIVPDALEAVIADLKAQGERPKVIYTISNFHNPTGVTLADDRRIALAEIAARHAMMILQDDAYGDIRWAGPTPRSLLAVAPEHAIELGTFSKSIAPGLRLGWAAGSPVVINAMARVRTDMGTTPMIQRLVERFLASGRFASHLESVVQLYRRKHDALVAALEEHCADYLTWNRVDGGFFLWLAVKDGVAADLAKIAVDEGVQFNPGGMFQIGRAQPEYFRLSFSYLSEDRLVEGARRLGVAARKYATRRGE
ncbi:MAG: PLP-dependent aminotransferase family protein [Dehalococcoidia bacterium]|nr:PLP-dependent aminotransferase family protein [Dehalococcoidia bacterium]